MTETISPEQRRVVNRLRRAQGQLTALTNAVESGANCRDILTQLAAVSKAIDRAGFAVVSTVMRDCVSDPAKAQTDHGVDAAELEKLFMMLA